MSPDPRLREAFALFDRDGDGELTSSEALLAIRSIGVVVNADEANGIPASMSWDQFESWVTKKLSGSNPEADLIKSFKVFDTKGDGTLSTDELMQVMKTLGDLLTDEEVEKMVQDADPSKSGRIKYAEFVKVLLSN
ncbi:calmodulin, putative [Eimeria tenella]|uniref:Calmodulin n=1 Tax=Eimeria tenella TaxID=5802 RepID=U6KY15_EIMTE|nr:calmodulin, putative [Eimeria tenella]CDJ43037.1 calmodulin, putative [Eimeria tenella]|eukprot:XP_013233787.1 calmodulin, putative [Eimeria tenella]